MPMLVLAAVALMAFVMAAASSRRGGDLELEGGDTYTMSDRQLVQQEAASLRSTIAAAEEPPSVLPMQDLQMNAANVPLGADLGSFVGEDPGRQEIAQAQAELRRAKRKAVRAAQMQTDEAEKAKLEKKVQKERVEYTRIALRERAKEGEVEVKKMRKKLMRREAHLEHMERERSRQRQAQAEVHRAKLWTQHQQVQSNRYID